MRQLIELEDFPRWNMSCTIYGLTRYVGTPNLQRVSGEFEQLFRHCERA